MGKYIGAFAHPQTEWLDDTGVDVWAYKWGYTSMSDHAYMRCNKINRPLEPNFSGNPRFG